MGDRKWEVGHPTNIDWKFIEYPLEIHRRYIEHGNASKILEFPSKIHWNPQKIRNPKKIKPESMLNLAKILRKSAEMRWKCKIPRKLTENPAQIQRKVTVAAKYYKIQAKTTLRDPATMVGEGSGRGQGGVREGSRGGRGGVREACIL